MPIVIIIVTVTATMTAEVSQFLAPVHYQHILLPLLWLLFGYWYGKVRMAAVTTTVK